MNTPRIFAFVVGLLFVFNFSWAAEVQTAPTPEYTTSCSTFAGGLPGGYCIHKPARVTRFTDVLYHLHGLGGSQFTWQETTYYTEQIRQEWRNNHAALPVVVSISFGPVWLLSQKNSSEISGLFDVLTGQVIPLIESQLKIKYGRRLLLGESMGAFNSIQLALKTKLFDRVAIIDAPMSELTPFATPTEVRQYIEKSSAWQYYKNRDPNQVIDAVEQALALSQAIFPTPEDWETANPLTLASKSIDDPRLYVTIGAYDRYASYEANEIFVKRLRAAGLKVDWHPLWGGHIAVDIPSLAKFLTR